MQVMPGSTFLMSQLHQQFLARSLQTAPAQHQNDPATTPPSSEDNMSPPPATTFPRIIGEDELADKQVCIIPPTYTSHTFHATHSHPPCNLFSALFSLLFFSGRVQ